jgi:hypothetical protein
MFRSGQLTAGLAFPPNLVGIQVGGQILVGVRRSRAVVIDSCSSAAAKVKETNLGGGI